MGWRERLGDRVISAEQAAALVRDGDGVMLGLPEPVAFLAALAGRPDLRDVAVYSAVANVGAVAAANHPGIRVTTMFSSAVGRPLVNAGTIEFLPLTFHAGAAFVERYAARVSVVVVAPPLADGTVRPGAAMGYDDAIVAGARRRGDLVLGLVIESQPQIPGDAFRIEDFDAFIAVPPDEVAPAVLRDASEHAPAFAGYLSELIPNGATVQAGIGGVPDPAMGLLLDKRDLGIHTEVLGAGLAGLAAAGVANGSRKSIHKGLTVCTICGPGAVPFAAENPGVRILGARGCLDPRIIAQNSCLRCVNSALEVDLGGQVNAEMMGGAQYAGVGGQLDFFRACRLADDALSILAIESTAAKGTVSRIVPWMREGHVVTSSRYDVDVVITEHGMAWLRDQSTRRRAEGLIGIAHPDFRGWLTEEAGRLGLFGRES